MTIIWYLPHSFYSLNPNLGSSEITIENVQDILVAANFLQVKVKYLSQRCRFINAGIFISDMEIYECGNIYIRDGDL